MSTLDDFGAWTKAERISEVINTPLKESSVLIHPDGQTLYFTSNGHPGMGGEDVYLSRKQKDGSWGTPVNLGYPINTHRNENSITVSASGDVAYFASNREGGYGGLDLYSFELAEGYRPMKVSYMEGTVVDRETGRPLSAQFELIDLETEEVIVESFSNGQDGTFLVSLPEGRDYALNVEQKGYLFFSDNFSLAESSSNEPYKKRIELSPIREGESVVLKNVFFSSNSYELSNRSRAELNTLVSFLNKNYRLQVEIGGHTDNVGKEASNKALSLNRAKAVQDFLVTAGIPLERLISKGYGASIPLADNDSEEGRAQNRRTEFKVLSVD
jgi:outer membrane protein OmpA-like peptidoglycan-associated protein